MRPIQRWLVGALVITFAVIAIYSYVQHQQLLMLLSLLILVSCYISNWITGKPLTVEKSYPKIQILAVIVGLLMLSFVAVFGYLAFVDGTQVITSLLFVLSLLGAIGTAVAGFLTVKQS